MTTARSDLSTFNATELTRLRNLNNSGALTVETPILVQGRAEELLREIPAESVHAIVTDPPYGLDIGRQKSGLVWDRAETNPAFDPSFWERALRVLKPGGLLLAFGASKTYHRLAVAIEDSGFILEESIMAWTRADKKLVDVNFAREFRKRGDNEMAEKFADCHSMFKPAYEPIVVARKPLDGRRLENIATHETGFLNFSEAYTPTTEDLSRIPGAPSKDGVMFYDRGGMERSTPHAGGRYPHNMVFLHTAQCDPKVGCAFDCSAALFEHEHAGKSKFFRSFYHSGRTPQKERVTADGAEDAHLTVKPLSVMEWLVGIATLPGQIILDPFAGSGTTMAAAERLGRRSVNFELGEQHAAIARSRMPGGANYMPAPRT